MTELLALPRPFGMSYWPLVEDAPAEAPEREEIRLVTEDGALVRGILWTPPAGRRWRTAVVLAHPRGEELEVALVDVPRFLARDAVGGRPAEVQRGGEQARGGGVAAGEAEQATHRAPRAASRPRPRRGETPGAAGP